MSKHTPGPWYSHPNRHGHEDRVWSTVGFIADVWSPDGDVGANARLIAAAPTMLDALKEAHPFITDDSAREFVGAMIEKAEGRS